MSIGDITKQLSKQYGGDMLGLDKKQKEKEDAERAAAWAAPRQQSDRPPTSSYSQGSTFGSGKLFPSERMELRSATVARPSRPPVFMGTFTLEELDYMATIPVKRHWQLADFCEVLDLPRDLHEKHDEALYSYIGKLFLTGKKAAHQR